MPSEVESPICVSDQHSVLGSWPAAEDLWGTRDCITSALSTMPEALQTPVPLGVLLAAAPVVDELRVIGAARAARRVVRVAVWATIRGGGWVTTGCGGGGSTAPAAADAVASG